ncbi:MAG: cytochrome c oxidase subunit II [SAR202 cluster bacterium]|jgi:cytochrome c oxidase subunit 2|nr:cytochrome c oxidase subunit II [SAR202 cluster bacterium]
MSTTSSRSKAYLGGLLLLLSSIALLTGCALDNPQSTFDTVGPVSQSQLNLFYWIFGTAVVVFVVVGTVLAYTTIRFRRKSPDDKPPQTHGNTPMEIGWTIVPVLLLAVVAVPTVLTIFDNANTPEPGALTVDAVGRQWWFEFKYPHPTDPDEQVITANELHIPVGEVVNINLASRDVIHSFWIPKIAGKVDMVPNNSNTIWIKSDEAGEFYGQCAEFCGEAHALMKFRVVAQPKAEYDAWLLGQTAPAPNAVEPLAAKGQALFEGNDAGCWACHTISGSAKSRGSVGPNLTHVASRGLIAAGIIENDQAGLRSWLTDPCESKPGNTMCTGAAVYNNPDKALDEEQISALVAYLRSLD